VITDSLMLNRSFALGRARSPSLCACVAIPLVVASFVSRLLPAGWYCLPLQISRSAGEVERDVHPDPFRSSRRIVLSVLGFPIRAGFDHGTVPFTPHKYDVCPKHKVSWLGASNLGSPVQCILQIAAIVLAGLLRPRLGLWISVPYVVH
jgi:hypothetical protein